MRKLILLITAISIVALLACSGENQSEHMAGQHDEHNMTAQKADQQEAEATYASWNAVCPVQGHEVDSAVPTVKYNGKTYGFCCEGCDKKFAKSPETYAKNLSADGKEFVAPES